MRPRKFDEDALLDHALQQFWCRGVRATTLSDVAKAAGMQRGSIYNAYGGKEQLFLAAYARYVRAYLTAVDKAMATETLRGQLLGYCTASINNFTAGSPARGCPTTKGLMEVTEADDENLGPLAQAALAETIDQVLRRVESAFEQGMERGEFSGDPQLAAAQLVAVIRGLVVLERAAMPVKQLRRVAEHTIDTLLRA